MAAQDPDHRERRKDDRYVVAPMYTAVVAHASGVVASLEGHAYDISASGVRIELDQPLPLGEHVAMDIHLPGTQSTVQASGDVVWVNDEVDDPGPRRMALQFDAFDSPGDRARLLKYLGVGEYRQAA